MTNPHFIVRRADGASPVATLDVLPGRAAPAVIELARGRNLVGRGSVSSYRPPWPEPCAVEGAQWVIECGAGGIRVADASSTNGSVVLPWDTELEGLSLTHAIARPGARRLVHPAENGGALSFVDVDPGAVLVTIYASLRVSVPR
ncbi:MAG: hypothetical protein U0414_24540 [Polyangiaceae bacterium]